MREDDQSVSPNVTDPATGTISFRFDWSTTLPSAAIIDMVAIATDREPVNLPPLYDYLDPDALDVVVRSRAETSRSNATSIRFRYDGYDVTVTGDGRVIVAASSR